MICINGLSKCETRKTKNAKQYFANKWNVLPLAILQLISLQISFFMAQFQNMEILTS